MGMPSSTDAKPITSPLTTSATLPTPAQTPSKGFPTPIADSYGDVFDLDAALSDDVPPAYAAVELDLALENPPVKVTVWYGTHILHGSLYHIPLLFYKLYERFLDISPSDRPRLDGASCKPWTLLNQLQGQTWVDEDLLHRLGVNTAQKANHEPRFVAITDKFEVLLRALAVDGHRLGAISVNGTFEPNTGIGASNDIIIGLPSSRALLGHRSAPMLFPNNLMGRPVELPTAGAQSIHLKELTPTPTSSIVMDTVAKILSAADNSKNITQVGVPRRTWIVNKLPDHFGNAAEAKFGPPASTPMRTPRTATTSPATPVPQFKASRTVTLSPSSPLWPHRGNEALFKRSIWQQLCYASYQCDANVESEGGVKIPDAYAQVLFEDLQGRPRVANSEELAEVHRKWYEGYEEMAWREGGLLVPGKGEGDADTLEKVKGDGDVGKGMEVD